MLSGELELAARPGRSQAELSAAVARAGDEVARLARLTDQLLFLARSDEDKIALRPERVSVRTVLAAAQSRRRRARARQGVSCQVEAPAGLMVEGGS